MRRTTILLAAAAALLASCATALAHVEVLPDSAAVQQAQEFTIRVPTERPLPTTAVQVTFPSQINVYAFAPPPTGWTMSRSQRDGRYTGVTYTGGTIPVGGYLDFHVLGTPTAAGTAVWRARQTYADGTVKPWTGPPEKPGAVSAEAGPTAQGPAAAVTVAATASAAAPGSAPASGGTGDDHSGAAVWLGIIGIVLAVLALLVGGLLWSSRPTTLPPDDPGEGTS
jgi:periplasmic copper chaperone A